MVYLYSTIKMMHGPINLRFKKGNFKQHMTFSGGINGDSASKYKKKSLNIFVDYIYIYIYKGFAGEWQ